MPERAPPRDLQAAWSSLRACHEIDCSIGTLIRRGFIFSRSHKGTKKHVNRLGVLVPLCEDLQTSSFMTAPKGF